MQSRILLAKYAVFFDLGAIFVAASFSFIARLGLSLTLTDYILPATIFILLALVIKPSFLKIAGVYRAYWGYISWREVGLLLLSTTAGSFGLLAAHFLLKSWLFPVGASIRRSVFAIDWLATLLAIGSIRVAAYASLQAKKTKPTSISWSHNNFDPEVGLSTSKGGPS